MAAYSGLYDGVYGTPYSNLSTSIAVGNAYDAIASLLANRLYGRAAVRELLYALLGAGAGATATAQHYRRKAFATPGGTDLNGGKVTIEQFTSVNRATTSADLSRLQNAVRLKNAPASYPRDRSGNGGGAKLGY